MDYTNQLRLGGMERRDALIATGKTRMRPILMTALTTILGMMMVLFSNDMASQLMSSMSIVIIGGLTYATFMTLYIVPMMYDLLFKRMPRVVDIGSEEDLDDVPRRRGRVPGAAVRPQAHRGVNPFAQSLLKPSRPAGMCGWAPRYRPCFPYGRRGLFVVPVKFTKYILKKLYSGYKIFPCKAPEIVI